MTLSCFFYFRAAPPTPMRYHASQFMCIIRPKTRTLRRATGFLAALFVWLSVLAPALHQHHQTRSAGQTAPSGHRASIVIVAPAASPLFFAPAAFAAEDFCTLCDYLTTTAFAPPPTAPICEFVRTGGLRGSPALVGFSAPLLSRAFSQVQLRGPPASA